MFVEDLFVNFTVALGLDVYRDKIKNAQQEKEFRKVLEPFIQQQSNYNESCSRDEELDFEGLANYTRTSFIDDAKLRLLGQEKERGTAIQSIIDKAVAYSQANTNLSRERATKFVSNAIDILSRFSREKVSKELLFISGEIEDAITQEMKDQHTEQNAQLFDKMDEIKESIISALSEKIDEQIIMSTDKNFNLVKAGKIVEVESNLDNWMHGVSKGHTLYPYYGLKPIESGIGTPLVSTPLRADSTKKYPPSFLCSGTMQINGHSIPALSVEDSDYAYRHQYPIIINIQTAQKLLGNILDPSQYEAQQLAGKTITIPPKPFPEAFPCSVSLDGGVVFDYVLFRTQEILDDGTVIMSNSEQIHSPFKITMKLYLDKRETDWHIETIDANNSDLLQYNHFLKKASNGAVISIKYLAEGIDLISGIISPFSCDSTFGTIDDEIAFLENIITIEKYYNTSINVSGGIQQEDYNSICYLATLINGETYQGNWSKFECTLELTENMISKISHTDTSNFSIAHIVNIDKDLFDVSYKIPIKRTYLKTQLVDFPKLQQKVKVLEPGDPIKLEFIPLEEDGHGVFTDVLYTKAEGTDKEE